MNKKYEDLDWVVELLQEGVVIRAQDCHPSKSPETACHACLATATKYRGTLAGINKRNRLQQAHKKLGIFIPEWTTNFRNPPQPPKRK